MTTYRDRITFIPEDFDGSKEKYPYFLALCEYAFNGADKNVTNSLCAYITKVLGDNGLDISSFKVKSFGDIKNVLNLKLNVGDRTPIEIKVEIFNLEKMESETTFDYYHRGRNLIFEYREAVSKIETNQLIVDALVKEADQAAIESFKRSVCENTPQILFERDIKTLADAFEFVHKREKILERFMPEEKVNLINTSINNDINALPNNDGNLITTPLPNPYLLDIRHQSPYINYQPFDNGTNDVNNSTNFLFHSDKPINCFKNQFIFLRGSRRECREEVIFGKERTLFFSPRFTREDFNEIFINYMQYENVCGVYFENDGDLNTFTETLASMIHPNQIVYKTDRFLKDIRNLSKAEHIINHFHLKQNHEQLNFNEILNNYFRPKLKSIIRKVISNCRCCSRGGFLPQNLLQRGTFYRNC